MVSSLPYRVGPDGVRLTLRLTPRANRTGLDGLVADAEGGIALQIRVVAPPVDGAANAALIAYLSEVLGVRRSDLRIVAGQTGRRKVVHLAGDGLAIADRLAAWIGDAPMRR